ncbi:MAG: hypothetical protein ACTHXO_04290 [Actinomycetaceae bacterium]
MRLLRRPSVVSSDGPSLTTSARLTVDSALLLVKVVGATSAEIPELDERIGDLHRSTARLGADITDRLVEDLVLPFERSDLHRVVSSERDVVHAVLRTARTLLADRTAPTPPPVIEAADEVLRATELLAVATAALRRPDRLAEIAAETARVHLDLETARHRATATSAASGDRVSVLVLADLLGSLADAVANCAAAARDLRILAAGAGRR